MKSVSPPRAVALDFDGVVLESVDAKTDAFRELFADSPHVDAIVEYHVRHGGVSRYEKFRHIYETFHGRAIEPSEMARLDGQFATLVKRRLHACPLVAGAHEFLTAARGRVPVFVVSATPEAELRGIIGERGLEPFLTGSFGSPVPKQAHLQRIVAQVGCATSELLVVGDAAADRDAARAVGAAFVHRRTPGAPLLSDVDDVIENLASLAVLCGLPQPA